MNYDDWSKNVMIGNYSELFDSLSKDSFNSSL